MWFRIFTILGIAFVAYWLITNPKGFGNVISNILTGLGKAADSIITVLNTVFGVIITLPSPYW